MTATDRLERLTDLVLVLVNAEQPLSLETIAREVPGYPIEHEGRRQAFERDKRLLRDEGIPVVAELIGGEAQYGYRIDPGALYLADLGLEADEQAALHLAVAGVHLGDPSGRHALLKLGATGLTETWPMAALEPPPALVPLFDALRAKAEVRFGYRGANRRVAPAGLWFRNGHWYLVGWDLERDAGRTFRVDRVEGHPEHGAPGSATVPEHFDASAALPDEPWRVGEGDEEEVLVKVDAVEGPRVVAEVGESGVDHRDPDGGVVVRLRVTNRAALRSWVLGLLQHAEVMGPPEVRQLMVQWLSAVAAGSAAIEWSAASPPPTPTAEEPAGRQRPGGPAPDASARLRRLLAIVGWLARVGEAPISEVTRRFGIAEDELVRELELAACCGVPPYTPDVLMEIEVSDETVRTFLPADLGRPRRLTPAEGFALAAAARTILAVPGADQDGALARALSKLDAALGDHTGLVVELESAPLLDVVRDAAQQGAPLEIDYYSASSDEVTTRVVDPIRVVTLDGHWYLDAACRKAGDIRRFRVDRIRSAQAVTGEARSQHGPPLELEGADAFVPGPGATRVRLLLENGANWVTESVPVLERVERADGRVEVVLAVGGTAWLARLLLQLGPDASVLDPPELRDTGALAARRLLEVYGSA